jgi:hypothetical protein
MESAILRPQYALVTLDATTFSIMYPVVCAALSSARKTVTAVQLSEHRVYCVPIYFTVGSEPLGLGGPKNIVFSGAKSAALINPFPFKTASGIFSVRVTFHKFIGYSCQSFK